MVGIEADSGLCRSGRHLVPPEQLRVELLRLRDVVRKEGEMRNPGYGRPGRRCGLSYEETWKKYCDGKDGQGTAIRHEIAPHAILRQHEADPILNTLASQSHGL